MIESLTELAEAAQRARKLFLDDPYASLQFHVWYWIGKHLQSGELIEAHIRRTGRAPIAKGFVLYTEKVYVHPRLDQTSEKPIHLPEVRLLLPPETCVFNFKRGSGAEVEGFSISRSPQSDIQLCLSDSVGRVRHVTVPANIDPAHPLVYQLFNGYEISFQRLLHLDR